MLDSIEWLRIFILNHQSYEYIIIFFGAAFGGEFALFGLGFLAAQGVLSTFSVIILSFLGAFLPNMLWFFVGRTSLVNKIFLHRYAHTTTSIINETVEKMSQGSPLMAIILTKFTFGTPILLTLYINKTDIGFKKFVYYETVAIILSLLVVMPIGFLSGYGFLYLAKVFDNLYAAIGFILVIVFLILFFKSLVQKLFTKSIKK